METKIQVRTHDSPLTPDEFQSLERLPLTVILDNLRSAFNVGSIFRTADCALVKEVIACGTTAHPPHQKLDKTSLGAIDYVPNRYFSKTIDAVEEMKQQGIPVIALELTDQSHTLWDYDFPMPAAIVLGNEALGVDERVLNKVDAIIEIPMLGYKNSMNVASTFSVVAYEIHRQYWQQQSHVSRVRAAQMNRERFPYAQG